MPDKTWKAVERAIARLFGGKRTGPIGSGVPDILHPWLAIEVKSRKRLPKLLHDTMQQAEENAGNPAFLKLVATEYCIPLAGLELLPIAVLHQTGDRYTEAFVVIRLGEFIDRWVGGEDAQEVE